MTLGRTAQGFVLRPVQETARPAAAWRGESGSLGEADARRRLGGRLGESGDDLRIEIGSVRPDDGLTELIHGHLLEHPGVLQWPEDLAREQRFEVDVPELAVGEQHPHDVRPKRNGRADAGRPHGSGSIGSSGRMCSARSRKSTWK
jgi:hypothetical protein